MGCYTEGRGAKRAQFEFLLSRGCLSLKHSISVISENIATGLNNILPKTRFSGPHFCHIVGPKSIQFGEIAQNNGHYAA